MKIAKPLLLVTTPLGIAGGLFEAYRLAGGLVILMAAMMGVVGAGFGMVVAAVRREKAAERASRDSGTQQPQAAAGHRPGRV